LENFPAEKGGIRMPEFSAVAKSDPQRLRFFHSPEAAAAFP